MKTELNAKQIDSLIDMFYNVLVYSNPDIRLGELGECRDAAKEVVNGWIELNDIKVID